MSKIKLSKEDRKEILETAMETNKKRRKRPYQAIGDIKGVRKTSYRFEFMKLPDDFEGKSVLDIGCNLGAMCQLAKERGAGRVVGIDKSAKLMETANNVFSRHGYDMSFITYNMNDRGFEPLLEVLGEEKFDYVFALSIYHHVKDKQVLWDTINHYCKTSCWFEGHKRNSREEIRNALTSNLNAKKIEYLGNIKDQVSRANYRCDF